MRLANAVTAALAGVVAVVVVAPYVPAAVGLALGATVATAVTWRGDTDRYGLTGALLLIGTGTAVLVLGRFPTAWSRTPLVALWVFGSLSLTVAALRVVLGVVGRRAVALFVADENTDSVWDAVSAFAGTLVIAWSVLTAQEKAARIGGVSLGGTATMALNTAGYEFPMLVPFLHRQLAVTVAGYEVAVPLWVLRQGVDATMVTFVGCVIVGFHTLGTLAATWGAVRDTTGRAAEKAESRTKAGRGSGSGTGTGTVTGPETGTGRAGRAGGGQDPAGGRGQSGSQRPTDGQSGRGSDRTRGRD